MAERRRRWRRWGRRLLVGSPPRNRSIDRGARTRWTSSSARIRETSPAATGRRSSGRSGGNVLPHAGLPEDLLGGVRGPTGPPAAGVRRGRGPGGCGGVGAARRDPAVPRRDRGDRLHGPRRVAGGTVDRREGAVRGARPRRRLGGGRPARPARGPAMVGAPRRGGCGAGFSTEVLEDQNGVAPILPCPARTRSTSSACPRNSVTRSSERRVASRARSVRGTSAWRRRTRSRRSWIGSSSCTVRARARRVSSCNRGWRSSFGGSARSSLPHGVFSLTFIETAEHVKLAGSIGFRFEAPTRSTTRRSTARTWRRHPGWCSCRGHPHRDRSGLFRVRHAEGRLRVQVSVRRDAEAIRRLIVRR